jgi:hypothetical protein
VAQQAMIAAVQLSTEIIQPQFSNHQLKREFKQQYLSYSYKQAT